MDEEETGMRQKRRVVIAMLAVAVTCAGILTVTVSGAGKPAPPPEIPVIVTFRDGSAPADRLKSDGAGSYRNGATNLKGVVAVKAVLAGSTGSLQLLTCFAGTGKYAQSCTSQGRYQFFDFTAPYVASPPPVQTLLQGAQMQVWIFGPDGVNNLANGFRDAMGYKGATYWAGSKTNFEINGVMHTVRFTPNMYANSDYLLVTFLGGSLSCTTSDPTACATWTVEAGAANGYGDIAELVKGDNSVDYGQFHMPFQITISVVPK
jgi:hypothetical protein